MAQPHAALIRLARGHNSPTTAKVTVPIVDSAIEHGMAPLLDDERETAQMPGDRDALIALAMHRLNSSAGTAAAARVLTELLDSAGRIGIEIGLVKGLAIGQRWYPSPDLRPAIDVDIFVNPDDAHRLGEFVELLTSRPESRIAVDAMVAEGRVFEYSIPIQGIPVDLHIDPMNLVVLTRQRQLVWERAEVLSLPAGRSIKALDLEMSIVQALLHLFRDNFADLLHFCDIDRMINAGPDWEFVTTYAEAEGLTDLIRFSLGYACEILDRPSPLPTEIGRSSRLLIRAIWPRRIRLKGGDSVARSYRRQSLASLLVAGRRIDVARALIGRAFPPRIVIDDRFEPCGCPYPIALLRWRLAQRSEIKRRNTAPTRRIHASV